MLLGVWGNTVCCSIDHPFDVGKILLVAAYWFWVACGWVLFVGWCVV